MGTCVAGSTVNEMTDCFCTSSKQKSNIHGHNDNTAKQNTRLTLQKSKSDKSGTRATIITVKRTESGEYNTN